MSVHVLAPRLTREGALRKIAEGMRLQSEGYAELAVLEPEPERPVAQDEQWVTWDVIAQETGLSLRTLDRMTKGKACRSRRRGRVLIERRGFAALLKRG